MTGIETTCMNLKVCKFNGCEILRYLSCAIDYSNAVGESILYAMKLIYNASQKVSSDRLNAELALIKIQSIAEEMPPINLSFGKSEKKPKYIRQQHKLAQRHFRRK